MKLNNLIMFAAGAAIGSLVTWKLIKTKYEQIAQEEIDSVKEVYSNRNKTEETADESKTDWIDESIETLNNIIKESGYANASEEKEEEIKMEPYVIRPDEFGELDYDAITLTYYSNDILTDEMDQPMDEEEIEATIGQDSLTHFGEYEDDSVFVRNDELKIDYEILRDICDWEG